MSLFTVDVIIPAYNASRFIGETIQSVLDQTLLPRKIIIVNDGSTDNTVEIVKSLENDLIELITAEHGGVSRARNIGIKESEADYIAFLDADDIWSSTKLEAQLRQLERNPAASVCYSGTQAIDEKGGEIKNTLGKPCLRGRVFEDIVLYERPISGSASSIIVSRDVLLQTKLFDETMQYSEDADLWVRLSLLTEFDYVSLPHVKIRINSSSVTRNVNWEKSRKILLQHFYYVNKFANQHRLPKQTLLIHQRRIIYLFLNYPSKLLEFFSFYHSLRQTAPHLNRQIGYANNLLYIGKILFVLFDDVFRRILILPYKVLRRITIYFLKWL